MIQFSKAAEAANSRLFPTNIHERFTGNLEIGVYYNRSDQPIQKIDFTNINMEQSMSHCIPRLVKG